MNERRILCKIKAALRTGVYACGAFGIGALRHIDLMKNPLPVAVIRYKCYGVVKAEKN